MSFDNGDFNDYLNNIRHGRDNNKGSMNPQKAQFIIDSQRAIEGLSLINELESSRCHSAQLEQRLQEQDSKINEQTQIIKEYVKTFGEYKIKNSSMGYSLADRLHNKDLNITMPETNSYKFYKKVFHTEDYPYSKIKEGDNIKLSINLVDNGYEIVSKKVSTIKIIPNRK